MNKYLRISIAVIGCLAIGYFSGTYTKESIETWYPMLVKPSFNPPNWIFAPVWSLLYLMMGVSAGLVWDKIEDRREQVKIGLKFFVVQLALNAFWSYLFFELKNPLLALVEIVLLWLMIYETYLKFTKIDKVAGYLLVPYLLWVGFASVLNAAIWLLNR